jgi:archaemetzincin
MKLGLILFGLEERELIENLKDHLEKVFGAEIILIKRAQMPECHKRGDQYLADDFIIPISKIAESKTDQKLGIVGVDLYSSNLNFVFGLASPLEKSAIISLQRLRTANKELYSERAKKEATHEIGHLLGLTHCIDRGCVMHFSNSILDTDYKNSFPCERCNKRLSYFLSPYRRI